MLIPKYSSHHDYTGDTDGSPKVHQELGLMSNPVTYQIILPIAVISFAILLAKLIECLRPYIAPDDHPVHWQEEEGYEQHQEDGGQPWSFTLTEDGTLLDNESGRPGQYGTFCADDGSWYNADGTEMSYNQWIETVYDPLD